VSAAPRSRWRERRVVVAWLLFAACAGGVLYLGGTDFSATQTHGILGPLINWLFPDWTADERYLFHLRVRKLAHPLEYGVLALVAFHAVFVTLETLIARITALALLLVLSVAATDELRQSFLATRTGAIGDVALDLLGAGVGLALAVAMRLHLGRRAARGTAP
jgi:VanZ family protein